VPARDEKSLSDAMLRMLKSHEMRERFGLAGYERVGTHFSLAATVRKTEELYTMLLEERMWRDTPPGRGAECFPGSFFWDFCFPAKADRTSATLHSNRTKVRQQPVDLLRTTDRCGMRFCCIGGGEPEDIRLSSTWTTVRGSQSILPYQLNEMSEIS